MFKIVIPEQLRTLAIIKAVRSLEEALNSNKREGVMMPTGFEVVEVFN